MTSQPLVLGVAGCAQLCHSRFLPQHRRPALRHASLLPLHPLSHRQSHSLRVKPGELTHQSVQPFFPLRFVTWSPPVYSYESGLLHLYLYSPTAFSVRPIQFRNFPTFFSASPEASKSGLFVAFPTSSLTFPFTSWSLPSVRSCVLGLITLSFLLVVVA